MFITIFFYLIGNIWRFFSNILLAAFRSGSNLIRRVFMKNKNKLLDALTFRQSGLNVLPAKRSKKFPIDIKWKKYLENPASERELREWFNSGKYDALCILTGQGVEAIDFDDTKAFDDFVSKLNETKKDRELLQKLYCQRTPSGGSHFIYRVEGMDIPKSTKLAVGRISVEGEGSYKLESGKTIKVQTKESHTLKAKKDGDEWFFSPTLIETRGTGGLILCAPTEGYKIVRGKLENLTLLNPDERRILIELAESFDMIGSHKKTKKNNTRKKKKWKPDLSKPGDRYSNKISPKDLLDLFRRHDWKLAREDNEHYHLTRPGKDVKDGSSGTIIKNAPIFHCFSSNAEPFQPDESYSPFEVRALLEHDGDFSACSRILLAEEQENAPWSPPKELSRSIPSAPDFPADTLPSAVADFCTDTAERMSCDLSMIAIPVLVMLAGLCGKNVNIMPKRYDDSWKERACLWGIVIAPKGSMKSPALKEATTELYRIQKELSKQYQIELEKWEREEAERTYRKKAYEKNCLKKLVVDPNAPMPCMPKELEKNNPKPKQRRIVIDDATIEKIGVFMENSPNMILVQDELSKLLTNMNRYNSGNDRAFWLQLHAGGPSSVDRMSRKTINTDDAYCNIIGCIQPKVCEDLFSNRNDDGFFERFGLIAYPESFSRPIVDFKPDHTKREKFSQLCKILYQADWLKEISNKEAEVRGEKPVVRFAEDAQDIFLQWLKEHMVELSNQKYETDIDGFMGKKRGLLVRICLVIHISAYISDEEKDPHYLSLRSLERAIKLVENYCVPMWKRVLGSFSQSPVEMGAEKIVSWLKRDKPSKFTVRDIKRKGWRGLREDGSVLGALDILIEKDWVRKDSVNSRGRHANRFIVNPLID